MLVIIKDKTIYIGMSVKMTKRRHITTVGAIAICQANWKLKYRAPVPPTIMTQTYNSPDQITIDNHPPQITLIVITTKLAQTYLTIKK